jgi:hypothetical protein
MNRLVVVAVIAASFISFQAQAQERAGSAALGAVSGAVVLGPVGAVAGALIGYTAGPAIAHSWKVGQSRSRARPLRATQSGQATEQRAAKVAPPEVRKPPEQPLKSPERPAKAPEQVASGKTAPPVQGFE